MCVYRHIYIYKYQITHIHTHQGDAIPPHQLPPSSRAQVAACRVCHGSRAPKSARQRSNCFRVAYRWSSALYVWHKCKWHQPSWMITYICIHLCVYTYISARQQGARFWVASRWASAALYVWLKSKWYQPSWMLTFICMNGCLYMFKSARQRCAYFWVVCRFSPTVLLLSLWLCVRD